MARDDEPRRRLRIVNPEAVLDTASALNYFPARCTIHESIETRDDYGGVILTEEDDSTPIGDGLQCRVEPLGDSSRELRRKDGTLVVHARIIRFRHYHPEILEEHVALVDGETYDILLVDHDATKAHTRLVAEKVS